MTTCSPKAEGMMDTLTSISFSLTRTLILPSWGSLFSATSRPAITLILETMAFCARFGGVYVS